MRRERLREELEKSPVGIELSPILPGDAKAVTEQVRRFEFEGVIAKRLDSIYEPGETSSLWQKQKTQRSDDFLVGGYIPGSAGVDELVVGEKRGAIITLLSRSKMGLRPRHARECSAR